MDASSSPPPPDAPAGTKLLGEVITWACPGAAVRHADLVAALAAAGLDERVARELAPRNAFTRACKRLARARVIRQAAEDASTITFQFTAEARHGDRYEYELETMLTLDKKTGGVTCGLPGLATLAQEELDRCTDARTGADVTRIVQALFARHADLFPIREQGGAYFVPAAHAGFVGRVAGFLGRVNGRVARFPVPAGTADGDRSVRGAVAAGLSGLIDDYRRAVAGFDADTRPGTVARAAERIRAAKFKVECYAEYLAGEKDRLDREVVAAGRELRAKVAAIAAASPVAAS